MQGLANERPVFHSEADFQHALAWHLHRAMPDASVRLEVPLRFGSQVLHVDIVVQANGILWGLELKYKCQTLTISVCGERFQLLNAGARDQGSYDVWKDVARLESLKKTMRSTRGHTVFLTNDDGYWNGPKNPTVCFSEFSLQEGRRAYGRLDWSPSASQGTKTKSREEPITLTGEYQVKWHPYSRVGEDRYSSFRYLIIEVPGEHASA